MPLGRRIRDVAHTCAAWDERAVVVAVACTREHPSLRRAAVAWDVAFTARRVDLVVLPAVALAAARVSRSGLPTATTSARAVGTVLLGWAAQAGAKAAWRRPRPDVVALVATPGSSTPSGHVTNLTVAAIVVDGLVAGSALSPAGRRAVAAALVLVVVLTALDRVAVGAHRPSDVALGTLLGVAVGTACTRLPPHVPAHIPAAGPWPSTAPASEAL